jgi:hypothetical protein
VLKRLLRQFRWFLEKCCKAYCPKPVNDSLIPATLPSLDYILNYFLEKGGVYETETLHNESLGRFTGIGLLQNGQKNV